MTDEELQASIDRVFSGWPREHRGRRPGRKKVTDRAVRAAQRRLFAAPAPELKISAEQIAEAGRRLFGKEAPSSELEDTAVEVFDRLDARERQVTNLSESFRRRVRSSRGRVPEA